MNMPPDTHCPILNMPQQHIWSDTFLFETNIDHLAYIVLSYTHIKLGGKTHIALS